MVNKDQVVIAGSVGLVAIAIAVLVIVAVANVSIQSSGNIVSVGLKVYGDEALTKELSAVDWGSIPAGGSKQVTLWIKSTSTNTNETLSFSVSNWSPSVASSYITITWSANGTKISPNQVIATDMTLNVNPNISGVNAFSNTITLTGTQS